MLHWKEKFWPPDDACSADTEGGITVKAVNVSDMAGIFFIFGCKYKNTFQNKCTERIESNSDLESTDSTGA